MTVRELLEQARDAVIQTRKYNESMELLRVGIGVQGHTYGIHSKNGIFDPMRKVDELMEAESVKFNAYALEEAVDDAREIIAGIAKISDPMSVMVVESYYIGASSWYEVADMALDWPKSMREMTRKKRAAAVQEANDALMLQWEAIGVARLRELAKNG